MTTTTRIYNGAADAAELYDTHPCTYSWCSRHCGWELDTDGSITRTHRVDVEGFSLIHTEPAPGDDPLDVEASVLLPGDLVGLLGLEEARSVAATLSYMTALADRARRERAGR